MKATFDLKWYEALKSSIICSSIRNTNDTLVNQQQDHEQLLARLWLSRLNAVSVPLPAITNLKPTISYTPHLWNTDHHLFKWIEAKLHIWLPQQGPVDKTFSTSALSMRLRAPNQITSHPWKWLFRHISWSKTYNFT